MREIQCKRCFFFTPEWCSKKRDSLDPDLIRDCQYFRIKTNADRIRSMPDEELVSVLACPPTESSFYCAPSIACDECILNWLKQVCDENGQT